MVSARAKGVLEKLNVYVIKATLLVLKVALALVLVVALFIVGGIGADYYYRTPLQQFCSEVELNKPVSDVITLAEGHSFFILDMRDKYDRVGILNHRAHYFRYECAITVVNDVVTEAKMVIAD